MSGEKNFLHAYDPATGEFLYLCYGPSPAQVQAWENEGLTVVGGTSAESPETHHYKGGVLTPRVAVTITPDKAEIAADGSDQAVVAVAVAGESPPANIDIDVDGVVATVNLIDGQGQLPPITSPVEHVFDIRVSDQITYRDGGGCIVTALYQE